MRKRFKIPLFGLVSVTLIIIAALVLLYKSHIPENWVNRYLAQKIAAEYNCDVTISEIEGSFIGGFILSDIHVRFIQDGDTVTLAHLPRVSISYNFSDLWHRRWIINSLHFEKPRLYLKKDLSGNWVLPRVSGASATGNRAPSWEIKKLVVDSASFDLVLGEKEWHWFGIDLLASARSEEGTYTLNLDTLRFNSNDGRLRVNNGSGMATLFEKNLVLQNVYIVTDSSRIAFSLITDNKDGVRAEAKLDSAHIHLPDITSFLGLNLIGDLDLSGNIYHQFGKTGGSLSLSGTFENRSIDSLTARFHYDDGVVYVDTLHGTILRGCGINGFGDLDLASRPEAYRLTARVDSFNLNQLVFDSFESNLSGVLEMNGRGLGSRTMAIDLDLQLDESYFDIYHFHAAQGRMTVTNGGLYFFTGCQVTYHENRFFFEGNINYSGELEINGRADLDDLSDFAYQTFIDLPAGRADGEFSFTGPTNDPDLAGRFQSDSIWFYEFFSSDFAADFDIRSFTRKMKGSITVQGRDGEAWSFPYDSLRSAMTLDSNLLIIDSGHMANDFSRSMVRGVLDFEAYPQELTFDEVVIDLTGRQFVSDGSQVIRVDSSGFVFDRIVLNASDGRLAFSGQAGYDETLDIEWDIQRISIAPWAVMINDSLLLDGNLSSTGKVYGKLDNPAFDLQARIDSLSYHSLHLGDLQTFLSYQDSILRIDSSLLHSPNGMYTASGTLPINLSLYSGGNLFDDREQNIYIYARDRRLDLFAFLLESVEYITGDFEATVALTGPPRQPHLNGTSILKNGAIKLIDLRDRLEQVEVEVKMDDQLIKINNMQAVMPHKKSKRYGEVSAGGTIFVSDINNFTYDISVQCANMPINYELGDFTGLADARLQVKGTTPPRVTGTILMRSACYRENFTTDESSLNLLTALEWDNSWSLDLMVECPSNAWVKNDDIDAEFSGSINILRDLGTYNFLGTLEVIRGKLFFVDRMFKMHPGGRIIYNNIEEPDPMLDLIISTRIRSQSQFSDFESEDSYTYELTLQVSGTLDNPIITGTGDTPISTEDILPTLFTGYQPPGSDSLEGESVGADRITSGLGGILAGQFSRLGTRTLGVETFEISPGTGRGFDPLATRLTIGAYTLPNLYIFGSSAVDVEKGQEVGVEYRLGRHYMFEGRRDESNLYQFNFKFYWEY